MKPVTPALAVVALAVAALVGAEPLAVAPPPQEAAAAAGEKPEKQKRARVSTDLTSFEMLTPEQLEQRTTVAAGTRSLRPPPPEPVAPFLGRSLTTRPTLTWEARDVAVEVVVADEGGSEVLRRGVAESRLEWGDAPPLEAGRTYTWWVEDGRGRSSDARIAVVAGADRESLEQALAAIPGDSLDARVNRARTLAWRGVWYDALDLYGRLIAENPERGDLYRERAAVLASVHRGSAASGADMERAAGLDRP